MKLNSNPTYHGIMRKLQAFPLLQVSRVLAADTEERLDLSISPGQG